MDIRAQKLSDGYWIATDQDTYDGTGTMGTGETELEAIADLREQLSVNNREVVDHGQNTR